MLNSAYINLRRTAARVLHNPCPLQYTTSAAAAVVLHSNELVQLRSRHGLICSQRWSSTITTTQPASNISNIEWNRTFSAAEKIVGYPTSFMSLRWLLSDEIANVAGHLKKLVGTNHPLLKTAKKMLYNGKNNMQTWGLIVLLLSKTAGQSPAAAALGKVDEVDASAGVLPSQRALAEVTEMIRISHMVHQGLINLQPLAQAGQDMSLHGEMTFGNKIALLSGDYLLGNSCAELASLRNQQLVELISSAVRDLAEADFVGDRDEQNNPLPSKPLSPQQQALKYAHYVDATECAGHFDNLKPIEKNAVMGIPEQEWEMRQLLGTGSLLGKSCQGSMILAGMSANVQMNAYEFGKHMALAWQARQDLEPFLSDSIAVGTSFSLVSAPVIYHLEYAPELYADIQQKGCITVENVDYVKLHREIRSGPALEKTRGLLRKHTLRAMKCLNQYAPSDARTALQNIIVVLQEF